MTGRRRSGTRWPLSALDGQGSTCFYVFLFQPVDVLSGCGVANEKRVALGRTEDLVGVAIGEVQHVRRSYNYIEENVKHPSRIVYPPLEMIFSSRL